jgi:hypothetical protein
MAAAHEAVMTARRPPAGQLELKAARRDYLGAIVDYERALNALRLPVPPRLRDEMRLLSRLVSASGPGP